MNKQILYAIIFFEIIISGNTEAQLVKNLLFNSYDNIVKMDFASGVPVISYTGMSNGYEAIAHAEDGNGNIVFWVNANGIFNSNFIQMPGSVGLLADPSSAEINICPFPTNPNKFYVIYNAQTCSELYYSVVDMTLNGGLGDVTTLNSQFANGSYSEGLEIVRLNCGQTGFRLLAYECNVGLVSFDVTDLTISNKQMLYNFAGPQNSYDGRGELDYNNGRLGIAFGITTNPNEALLGDYNIATNVFSNPIDFTEPSTTANGLYGLEFSPDGSKAYISAWYENTGNNLFQYDFNSGLTNSWSIITTSFNIGEQGPGQIELASDGNLYMINNGAKEITVISNSNTTTPTFSTINVTSTLALGISDHIQSDLISSAVGINCTIVCIGDNTEFTVSGNYCNADSIVWNFGEPVSGNNNNGYGETIIHQYSTAGNFHAVASIYLNNGSLIKDSIVALVYAIPTVNVPETATICIHDPATVTATGIANHFFWSNGAQGLTTTFDEPGVYTITAENGECTASDNIEIIYECGPYLYIGNAFSPNGDGLNDFFKCYYYKITDFNFRIFDRWGQLVYESNNPDEGWDGTFNNLKASMGVYVYSIIATAETGEVFIRKGNVSLIK